MAKRQYYIYPTPMGRMTLVADDAKLVQAYFGAKELTFDYRACEVLNNAATQLQEYLAGKRTTFDIPLAPQGTDFQLSVWDAIARIPYGQTQTYAQIAEFIGNPNAFRAVGMAANKNPLPIFIPCHRVVGANGQLVGYAYGTKIKEFLLNLEMSRDAT